MCRYTVCMHGSLFMVCMHGSMRACRQTYHTHRRVFVCIDSNCTSSHQQVTNARPSGRELAGLCIEKFPVRHSWTLRHGLRTSQFVVLVPSIASPSQVTAQGNQRPTAPQRGIRPNIAEGSHEVKYRVKHVFLDTVYPSSDPPFGAG